MRALLLALLLATPAQAAFMWGNSQGQTFTGTAARDEMHGNGGADEFRSSGGDTLSGGNDFPDCPRRGEGNWDDLFYVQATTKAQQTVVHLGPGDYQQSTKNAQGPVIVVIHRAGPQGYIVPVSCPPTVNSSGALDGPQPGATWEAKANNFRPGVDLIAMQGDPTIREAVIASGRLDGVHFSGPAGERFFVRVRDGLEPVIGSKSVEQIIASWFL